MAISGGADVVSKAMVQGSRYKSKNILSDFTRGAIDGMMGYLGPLAVSKKVTQYEKLVG